MAPSPATPSRLTADARRTLALLAGDDLGSGEIPAARALADECPRCRTHLAEVRGGLDALAACEATGDRGESLWPSVRDSLPAVSLAPAERDYASRLNRWTPAFALTAAAVLVGAFTLGGDGSLGWLDGGADARPVSAERSERLPATDRPAMDRPVVDRYGRVIRVAPDRPAVRFGR